ncbi:11616_t:CDS:2 [Diversispora eburnea]|uniref:11616_t:CDS:1 n=1 Tax=Diversispora eburnea TaxID=1213867 RepID=A0A9N9GDB8_9GLOM|nr:11616_t:CDS:2 [Diversispora eburnea]
MNQKITFATILVAFSAFFIYFTDASPIGLSPRQPGSVAYCDFTNDVTGRITITELWSGSVRITGQFNTGFPDRTSKYEYQLSGEERGEIESDIIFPPGTAPFQCDYKDKTVKINMLFDVIHVMKECIM